MHERDPEPDPAAARLIARLLGPAFALILLTAWGVAWVRPEQDRQRFLAMQQAGREELPEPPPPDKSPGIDNRVLDPREKQHLTPPDKPPPPTDGRILPPPDGFEPPEGERHPDHPGGLPWRHPQGRQGGSPDGRTDDPPEDRHDGQPGQVPRRPRGERDEDSQQTLETFPSPGTDPVPTQQGAQVSP